MTFKKILKSLSKKEWKFILIISLISILLVSIPYIYGLINKPIDTTYNPIQGFSSGDKEVYNSYIEQIKQGNFLLKDLYTSENQNKVTLNIMWLSTGLFAKFFNLSNSLSFYLIQIFSIPFLFISIYSLLVLVWKSKIKRKIAFLFSIFSAGFGFLFVGIPKFESDYIINHPMDIWVSEAFTFTTIINSPHFIISLMLIILIFIFLYLSIENKNYKQSLIAGTLSLILFQFHPYHLPTILCVIFAYTILYSLKNKEKLLDNFKYPLILILTSSPSIIYHLIILKIDPISLAKSHQNICITPKLITVLLSYGFLLIGAVTYIWIFRNKKIKNIKLFLIIWFLVQFLLLYAPTQLQRRLSEGLHIPISILTILLFFYIQKKNRILKNKYLNIFLFILICLSNIFNIVRISSYQNIKFLQDIYYIQNEKIEAMKWLKDNLNDREIILAEYINGSIIPSLTGRTILLGHPHETLNFNKKYQEIKYFFSINLEEKNKEFLDKYNIKYIFYSNLEKKIGKWVPNNKDYIKKVFDNQKVQIYEIL